MIRTKSKLRWQRTWDLGKSHRRCPGHGRYAGSSWEISSDTLRWRHNERDGASNHQRLDGLLNRLFRRRSKNTSKFRLTGFCEGNLPVTDEFPSQKTSNAENASIWWRYHGRLNATIKSWYVKCFSQYWSFIKGIHRRIRLTKRQLHFWFVISWLQRLRYLCKLEFYLRKPTESLEIKWNKISGHFAIYAYLLVRHFGYLRIMLFK